MKGATGMAANRTNEQISTAPTEEEAGDLTTRMQYPAAAREQQLHRGYRRVCCMWRLCLMSLALLGIAYIVQAGTAIYTLCCGYSKRTAPELQLELEYSPCYSFEFFIPAIGAIPLLRHYRQPPAGEYKKLTIRRADGTFYSVCSGHFPPQIEDLHGIQTPDGLQLLEQDRRPVVDMPPIPPSAFRND